MLRINAHFDAAIDSLVAQIEPRPFGREYNAVNWRRADPEILRQVGRRCRRVQVWMNARYWPRVGVKLFAGAIRRTSGSKSSAQG
jgi:hypothetical protein